MLTATVADVDPDGQRDEWLRWRSLGIGASDVAGILGISPWSSPWSVWADHAGLLPPFETEVMEAGRWLERAIGPWFAHRTGMTVIAEQVCCERPGTVARCSADLLVAEGTPAIGAEWSATVDALCQIKTAHIGKKWETIPEYHQAQGQWEMHVTGLDVNYFAVLMGRRLDIHPLKRDQADIDFMVERVDEFWNNHVLTGEPPDTDGHDATLRALAEVYPHGTHGTQVRLDDIADELEAWQLAKANVKAAKEAEAEHAARIQAAIGDAEEGTVDGETVVSWREQSRKSIDADAVKKNHPAVAAECERTSTFRVLRPVNAKSERKAS